MFYIWHSLLYFWPAVTLRGLGLQTLLAWSVYMRKIAAQQMNVKIQPSQGHGWRKI